MKPQSSPLRFLTSILAFSSLGASWPGWLPDSDALVARQDTTAPVATPTGTNTSPKTTGDPSQTVSGTDAPTTTGSNRPSATRPPASGNRTHTTFNQQDPPGGVAMITPGPFDGTQLYKVGDYVTWAWNYTSLQGTPTAIDVLISCSVATRTWTLTQNMTFATRADFIWDTNDNKGSPYLVEQYTLLIHDSDTAITAPPEPGYLAPYSGLKFGVYTKQDYVPLASGWRCVSCSGAASSLDKRALGVSLVYGAVTVVAFTWFVAGVGAAL